MQEDHFIPIYKSQAPAYQRMVAAEDVENNLLPALRRLVDFSGQRVVDVGSGTGRMPYLLRQQAAGGIGVDLHDEMLRENRRQQVQVGFHWPLVQGDVRNLPFAGNCAGVVTAGWAIGHFCAWYGAQWRRNVERALREMARVARPGGSLLILETLGTGVLSPAPPTAGLAAYYQLLEEDWGFQRDEVSTDYQFASVEEAIACMAFFFGEALAREIERHGWARVPEWTGIWCLQL
ncbi:MAG TPA: methyltransferase domain-containing protein [Candidatus Binatia bacterium]|jgi:ubiquinone/menaquinone biosynthesis C-methylase UbiE|nr:methyltransferase domain-containing protein [Candidatus Binatia bacterium]